MVENYGKRDERTQFRADHDIQGAPEMSIGHAGCQRNRCAGNRTHDDRSGHEADNDKRPPDSQVSDEFIEGVAITNRGEHSRLGNIEIRACYQEEQKYPDNDFER